MSLTTKYGKTGIGRNGFCGSTASLSQKQKSILGSQKKRGKYNPSKYKSGPVVTIVYGPALPGQEFYQTREWLDLRYQALAKYGATCQCCGATRQSGATLQVDHIKPRSTHPMLELQLDNLQVLCRECNIGKSNKSVDDWR
jgi:hypothetical protein